VFVDVGANVGYFTLLAARCVGPEGGVVANDLELIIELAYDPQRLAQRAWLFEHLHSLGFHSYVLPETHRFHDYAYPERSRERPRRVGEPLTRVHNVIFSRIDADHL
jgi:hypothetical protein